MSNLTPIKGSTTQKKGSEAKLCPYCGLVPSEKHPDFTCPRLSGASWDDTGGSVEFIDPERWSVISKVVVDADSGS